MFTAELSLSHGNFSYKKKKTAFFLISLAWIFTSSLNTIKLLKHPHPFEFSDILWPVLIVLYIIILLDFFLSKTTFEIACGKLTVFNRALFYKSVRVFEINKMLDLEVEQVNTKTFPFKKVNPTNEQIITFFYDEKQTTLGTNLQNFNAEELFEALKSANSNPGKD